MLATLGSSGSKSFSFNNIDMQLRKCCNHLFLLKGVEEELTKHCHTEDELFKKMLDASGKMILLDKFIDKYKSDNHKMLVFSQFKGMIDVIKEYLIIKGIRHEVLTGSIKS
jgi:chromodomain-helicase-DNA-binding protein 7